MLFSICSHLSIGAQVYICNDAILCATDKIYYLDDHKSSKDSIFSSTPDNTIYAIEGTTIVGLDSAISINIVRKTESIDINTFKRTASNIFKKSQSKTIEDINVKNNDEEILKVTSLDDYRKFLIKLKDIGQGICSSTTFHKMVLSECISLKKTVKLIVDPPESIDNQTVKNQYECYLSIRPPPYKRFTIG